MDSSQTPFVPLTAAGWSLSSGPSSKPHRNETRRRWTTSSSAAGALTTWPAICSTPAPASHPRRLTQKISSVAKSFQNADLNDERRLQCCQLLINSFSPHVPAETDPSVLHFRQLLFEYTNAAAAREDVDRKIALAMLRRDEFDKALKEEKVAIGGLLEELRALEPLKDVDKLTPLDAVALPLDPAADRVSAYFSSLLASGES
jgi:hypothetical protein